MDNTWKKITDPEELFRLKREGWEFETTSLRGEEDWIRWAGTYWNIDRRYRGHPPIQKDINVRARCWRHRGTGQLTWTSDAPTNLITVWQRFPAGDIEGEVPDDN